MYKSKYTVNATPIHISDNMSGKMTGVPAISTACTDNPICQKRKNCDALVCSHCFAFGTLNRFKPAQKNAAENYETLTSRILNDDEIPVFGNVRFVRIESFGDIANVTHAVNYIKIAKKNPNVTFAWWTKNTWIAAAAMDREGKPDNIILIQSSPVLNKQQKPRNAYVDKVFTVYDKEHAENVKINCGSRSCVTCQRCYDRNNTEKYISEKLK